jgi:hypothetical protein
MHHLSPYIYEHDIAAVGRGLLDRSLPKSEWTHAGHFAAALWLLATYPEEQVARDLPRLIRAYNVATGVPNTDHEGYHATITMASLRAARHALTIYAGVPLTMVCALLLRDRYGDPGWLLAYWSRTLLFSVAARRGWQDPDSAPLPF